MWICGYIIASLIILFIIVLWVGYFECGLFPVHVGIFVRQIPRRNIARSKDKCVCNFDGHYQVSSIVLSFYR